MMPAEVVNTMNLQKKEYIGGKKQQSAMLELVHMQKQKPTRWFFFSIISNIEMRTRGGGGVSREVSEVVPLLLLLCIESR